MIKKILLVLVIIVLFSGIAVLFSFYISPQEPPPLVDDTNSDKQGIQTVVEANNKFAFDLYSKLNESEDGNIFYSPYSVSSALAMTYEGAKGNTADEIKSVFYFPENNILRPNFAAIYNKINEDNNDHELKTGNALWIQQDFPLLKEYTDRVEKYYGGKATNLDFIKETEKSRQIINTFIEKQTNDKIKNLIPKRFINPMTRLVLTNAIYFKGTWQWEFNELNTRERDFKVTPDKTVKTPMMNMSPNKTEFNYFDTGDLQILELPYKGDKISMLILLPTNDLDSIKSNLTAEKLNEYRSEMKKTKLDLISIPKFEFDTKYFMENTLSSLGMPTAFSQNADFSGMTGQKDLFIDFVIHQAYIKVDEIGTEAAAATAVGMRELAMVQRNTFEVDRPFIFIIQEKESGNILFLGKVADPTS